MEKSGAPALKLIGDVAPSAIVVTKTQKLTELYPYSYTDLSKLVKKLRPGASEREIQKVIQEQRMKQNEEFSVYNFRNKRQEDRYTKSKTLSRNVPSLYNQAAVELIVNALKRRN